MAYTTFNPSGVGVFGIEHPDYAPPARPRRRSGSGPAWRNDPASEAQLGLISTLLDSQDVPALKRTSLELELSREITKGRASDLITELKAYPTSAGAAPTARTDTAAAEGVYQTPDGTFYAVRTARTDATRRYAYEAIITDTAVRFDYAKGAVYRLGTARRLDLAEVEALSLQFSRCFLCGITLKAKDSKARGVGPVCAKKI